MTFIRTLSPRRGVRPATVLLTACVLLLAPAGRCAEEPAADLSQIITSELEKRAVFAVGARKFEEAVPYLKELCNRLNEATDEQAKNRLEGFRYFLGIGYAYLDNWDGASEAFGAFLTAHPKSARYQKVLELHADALAQTKRYPEAAQQYRKALEYRLTDLEAYPLLEKLADCEMRARQWEAAVPVLQEMLKKARTDAQREQAVVWLAQSYIESNQGAKVVEVLPDMLTRAPQARLSIDFNVALLNGGDKMFNAGQNVLALLFYNLVLPPGRVLEASQKLEADLLRRRQELLRAGQVEFVVDLNRKIRRIQADRELLADIPDFSEELLMRKAQAYFASSRMYETFWTYWRIYKDYPQGKLAEEACYGAFSLAAQLDQDAKAKEAGLNYLQLYKDGKHWEDVSLQLGQVFIRNREYATAIDFYTQILKARPEHVYKDQVLFMLGFAQFQDGRFADCRQTLQGLGRDFPNSDKASAAAYWIAMSYLFEDNYKDALDGFERFVEKATDGRLYEDACFRRAVCLYGLERYQEAAERLEAFLKEFPVDGLTPEAHTLLADCYGAIGELDKALAHYKEVEGCAMKQAQIDYAALQVGRIFEELGQYAEMESWFSNYLEKYGTRGDYTQAIYRKGFAQQAQNKSREAIETYLAAIEKFGNDRTAIGIDIILDAYAEEAKSVEGARPAETLKAASTAARTKNERARWLRLDRVISQLDPAASLPEVTKADLSFATPAVLIALAGKTGDPNLAEAAARTVIDDFPPCPWTAQAYLQLGNGAFARKDWKQAESAFARVVRASPMDEAAARATLRLGDVAREQKHYDEAQKRYESILQVKEWRGSLWPEAIYRIGETLRAQGKDKESYAYFQRIFVLYPHYAEWAAKAYVQCAEISEKLGKKEDAMRTLGELLANPSLRSTSEYVLAEQKLRAMQ